MRLMTLSAIAVLFAVSAIPAESQTLTVIVIGSGKVTGPGFDCGPQGPDCTETLPPSIGLRAAPRARVVLLTFTGQAVPTWGGACQGASGTTCTLMIPTSGANISVTFPSLPSGLSVLMPENWGAGISSLGPGKVSSSYTSPGNPYAGMTYRAEPDPGATFAYWLGKCTGRDPVCTAGSVMGPADFIKAHFGWPVTIVLQGGGRVTGGSETGIDCPTTCSGVVTPPTLTLQAVNTPGSPTTTGWAFLEWGGDCASAGRSTACSVPITGNMSVTASFLPTSIRVP
jgi:hypothetical protein